MIGVHTAVRFPVHKTLILQFSDANTHTTHTLKIEIKVAGAQEQELPRAHVDVDFDGTQKCRSHFPLFNGREREREKIS